MKKIFTFLICLFLFFPLFSEESSSESSQIVDKIKKEGGQILYDLGKAFKKAEDTIIKKSQDFVSGVCVGKWQFSNGKCTTTIECLDDGTMHIMEKSEHSTEIWRGTYIATLNEINFNVVEKNFRTSFTRGGDIMDEQWKIKYFAGTNSLRIQSDFIPDDKNGYDFSEETVFRKIN